MMRYSSPIVLNSIPTEPKLFTCKKVGSKCCMGNLREKRGEILKLGSENMKNGNVRVPIREQVSSVLYIQEKKVRDLGIERFMKGKVLLITGATGFLAKVLIEKILRAVPDVGKIYLLVRAKDKEAAVQRIKTEITNSEIFTSMKIKYGELFEEFVLSKLVPIIGDLSETDLGMDVCVADGIADDVDIIINSGGNTVFDERYDVSLGINTLGPCRLLRFAKTCKKLKLFLQVSTAYVNGERRGIVKEKPFHLGDSIAREKASSESSLSSIPVLDVEAEVYRAFNAREAFHDKTVPQMMKGMGLERAQTYGWQDTYVFTKAMGEMMIESEREDIPVVIVRPSVIESTIKEPIKGWIEGIRMLDPVLIHYAKGTLTGFPMDTNAVFDVIPADIVANVILAATVKHAKLSKSGVSVYHVGSSVANPMTFGECFRYIFEYFISSPYMDAKRGPIQVQKMKTFRTIEEFHSHISIEAMRNNPHVTKGKHFSPRLQKSLDAVKYLAKIYEPYAFYQGRFDNSNTEQLFEEMSQEEKASFGFDVGSINWKDYLCNIHIPGVLIHLLKGRGM